MLKLHIYALNYVKQCKDIVSLIYYSYGSNKKTQYAHPEVLVDTQWIEDHLNDPNVKIAEVDLHDLHRQIMT